MIAYLRSDVASRAAVSLLVASCVVACVLACASSMSGCGAGEGTATFLTAGPPTSAPAGDKVLYASLALGDRVVAYRLGTDGLLSAEPFSEIALENPRRVTVGDGVLHVALDEGIVSLILDAEGGLPSSPGAQTRPIVGADVFEMKILDGVLYAAAAGLLSVQAFELEASGVVPIDPLSNSGTTITDYATVAIGDGFIYAASRIAARIDTFFINEDGSLPPDPEQQIPSPEIFLPEDVAYADGTVYAIEQSDERINAYVVQSNGLLPSEADSMTDPTERYAQILVSDGVLYASAFNRGRIDAYRLDPVDGSLPPGPFAMTQFDTASFPSGLLLEDGILYVAQTGLDRIDAYVINADGSPTFFPTSSTDPIPGGFPSGIAIGSLP